MTNGLEILRRISQEDRGEETDAIRAAIDLIMSIQAENASTNEDDDPPSLPVMGNVDVPTLVTLGLWEAGRQIRFRKQAPTW